MFRVIGTALLTAWTALGIVSASPSGAWAKDPESGAQPRATGKPAESAPPAATAETAGKTFEPAGAGFRIELRGRPQDRSAYVDLPTSKVYTRLYVLADAARKRAVTISVNRLTEAADAEATAAVFDNARAGILAAVQGELLLERETALGEYPGRDWLVALNGSWYLHLRMFTAGRRMYQVCLESPEKSLDADDLRMFDSFRILDGVALVDPPRKYDWRWVTPEGEKFAVQLPDDPRESTERRATVVGEVDVRLLAWSPDDAGPRFTVAAAKLPQAACAEEAQKLLDEARERLLEPAGSYATGEEQISLGGNPGRKLTIVADDHARHVRLVVADDRLYELSAFGKPKPSEDDERFLNSLKLPQK